MNAAAFSAPTSTSVLRATVLVVGIFQPVSSLAVSSGWAAARPEATRSGRAIVAYEGGAAEPIFLVRDALMHRAVEQQISSFALVHDTARKSYLYEEWASFLKGAEEQPGTLTGFISKLQRAETTSVFVPKRLFRQLSPGNPYASPNIDGHNEEVRPTQIALSLISCREQLAEYWLELMPSLLQARTAADFKNSLLLSTLPSNQTAVAAVANATSSSAEESDYLNIYDKQLLLGIATKLAARQMLKELSLRPSCSHLHEWLKAYLLVQHAEDLTTRGSVERLHANLVAQPVCIRGGTVVDPVDISLELFQRSMEILERIEPDLRAAPEHIVPLTSGFLNDCLNL